MAASLKGHAGYKNNWQWNEYKASVRKYLKHIKARINIWWNTLRLACITQVNTGHADAHGDWPTQNHSSQFGVVVHVMITPTRSNLLKKHCTTNPVVLRWVLPLLKSSWIPCYIASFLSLPKNGVLVWCGFGSGLFFSSLASFDITLLWLRTVLQLFWWVHLFLWSFTCSGLGLKGANNWAPEWEWPVSWFANVLDRLYKAQIDGQASA